MQRLRPGSMFDDASEAVVYVAECPGYHYFDVRATEYTCTDRAHYGQSPNYLFYRSSGDGC